MEGWAIRQSIVLTVRDAITASRYAEDELCNDQLSIDYRRVIVTMSARYKDPVVVFIAERYHTMHFSLTFSIKKSFYKIPCSLHSQHYPQPNHCSQLFHIGWTSSN